MRLGYEIKLKSNAKINSLCYTTDDNIKGLGGIVYNRVMLNEHNFNKSTGVKVVGIYSIDSYDTGVIIENAVGQKTIIHFDWIEKIEQESVIASANDNISIYKVSESYIIDRSTLKIALIADMPICSCGAVGTLTLNDEAFCDDCSKNLIRKYDYSYKPTPNFIGTQLKSDKDNNVWYGLEVEVSAPERQLKSFMQKHRKGIYLKDDSTIRGTQYNVEIVSHPHSFSALMGKGSWLEDISKIEVQESTSNGCHVHISRTAFKDDKHYSLFYFLIHKMEKIATKVGGRDLTDYCQMLPTGKVHSKGNKQETGRGRSLFLNEQGSATVEARFFNGTTKTANLKAYVQLLESIIKYTKYHSKTVSIKGWFAYTTKQSAKYAELLLKVSKDDVTSGVVVFKEPKLKEIAFRRLKLSQLDNIVEVSFIDDSAGKDKMKISGVKFNSLDKRFIFTDNDGYNHYIPYDTITTVLVEE